jgi:hypothetical protein
MRRAVITLMVMAGSVAVCCAAQPLTSFLDGTYRVGVDIAPGTYQSDGQDCTWERLSAFGGTLGDIIAIEVGTPHPIVTISPSDKGFKSSRCGTWHKLPD